MEELELYPGNDFGNVILDLIEEQYETIEDGILAVAEVSGLDAEQVVGLIEGDYVPTDDLIEAVSYAFDGLDDETAYTGFVYIIKNLRY